MPPRKRVKEDAEPETKAAAARPAARAGRGKRSAPVAAAPAAPAAKKSKREETAKRKRVAKDFHLPLESGFVFTFGTNPFGALGLGEDVTEKPRAAHVDLQIDGKPVEVVQVVAGGMHTAALGRDGSVLTWGVNDEGALGRPTAGSAWESMPDGAGKEDPATPGRARLPDGVRAVALAAGDGFTFALAEGGAVWGWGCFKDDGSGTAGFPGAPAGKKLQPLPVKVYDPPDARAAVRRISAGARHMAALTRRGDVLTWGMGSQGQLGRVPPYNNERFPALSTLLEPAPVPGLAAALGGDVADVVCGAYGTFAISARGAVAAWGLNNAGQLALPLAGDAAAAAAAAAGSGDGGGGKRKRGGGKGSSGGGGGSAAPDGGASSSSEEGAGHFHWAPRPVPALEKVAAIAGGEHHTLALTRAGQVLSFGAPTYGMLGRSNVDAHASASDKHGPYPVDAADGLADEAVVGIAAGTNVSAAVTRGGNVYLWGSNVNYQMAKGADDDDNALPARMRRHKAFGQRRVLAVAFGGQHGVLLASEDAAAGGGSAPVSPP